MSLSYESLHQWWTATNSNMFKSKNWSNTDKSEQDSIAASTAEDTVR